MINWIIMIFFQLYTLGYLNLEQIFLTNLLLLITFRGLYILTYYINYYKDLNKELGENIKLFKKKEKIYLQLMFLINKMF